MNSAKVMFLFVVFGIFGPFGSISILRTCLNPDDHKGTERASVV